MNSNMTDRFIRIVHLESVHACIDYAQIPELFHS